MCYRFPIKVAVMRVEIRVSIRLAGLGRGWEGSVALVTISFVGSASRCCVSGGGVGLHRGFAILSSCRFMCLFRYCCCGLFEGHSAGWSHFAASCRSCRRERYRRAASSRSRDTCLLYDYISRSTT